MIGFLSGEIIAKDEEACRIVVNTQGVGYEISLDKHNFLKLETNSQVSLWVHTVVREDAFTLFGFQNENEKYLFRMLLNVSGLGPKSALSLISEHGTQKLIHCILEKDVDTLTSAPGVGKKTGQRIVLELSGKVQKLSWVIESPQMTRTKSDDTQPTKKTLHEDLKSALMNLGYHSSQLKVVLSSLMEKAEASNLGFEDCLKLALKNLSKVNVTASQPVNQMGEPNH